MSENFPCVHQRLDIVAPIAYWQALGCKVFLTPPEEDLCAIGEEDLLVLGIAESGAKDERAVAWAIREKQRRQELHDAQQSANMESEAIAQLAQAIRRLTETGCLEHLLTRLSTLKKAP